MESQVSKVLKPLFRVFLEAVSDDAFERRNRGVGPREVRWFVVQDGVEGIAQGDASERRESRQHLVNDNSNTEDVGAMVDATRARLFRGHVGPGSNHPPLLNAVDEE